MIILLLIPISTNIFRILENESRKYKKTGDSQLLNPRSFAIVLPHLPI